MEVQNKEEKDIKDFSEHGDFLKYSENFRMTYPISDSMYKIYKRSALFIEFMAAAFLKETGMRASECELVCRFEIDEIRWKFVKKEL